jgi:hypothetical protein
MSAVMRVMDVEALGQPALIVNTAGPRLLLLDAELTPAERISILGRFSEPLDGSE